MFKQRTLSTNLKHLFNKCSKAIHLYNNTINITIHNTDVVSAYLRGKFKYFMKSVAVTRKFRSISWGINRTLYVDG